MSGRETKRLGWGREKGGETQYLHCFIASIRQSSTGIQFRLEFSNPIADSFSMTAPLIVPIVTLYTGICLAGKQRS